MFMKIKIKSFMFMIGILVLFIGCQTNPSSKENNKLSTQPSNKNIEKVEKIDPVIINEDGTIPSNPANAMPNKEADDSKTFF